MFVRGNANNDEKINIADGVAILFHQFDTTFEVPCLDAADANDDGKVDVADAIWLFGYLFSGEAAPPAPFGTCGPDPTPDDLITCEFTNCP